MGVASQTHVKIGPCSKATTFKTLPVQNVSDNPSLPKRPEETSKKVCNSSPGWPQLADSCRVGVWQGGTTGSQECGASVFPQAEALWREVLNPGMMAPVSSMGEGFNTGMLAAVPPAFSPKPQNPISPCMTSVYSELPFLCQSPG